MALGGSPWIPMNYGEKKQNMFFLEKKDMANFFWRAGVYFSRCEPFQAEILSSQQKKMKVVPPESGS